MGIKKTQQKNNPLENQEEKFMLNTK